MKTITTRTLLFAYVAYKFYSYISTRHARHRAESTRARCLRCDVSVGIAGAGFGGIAVAKQCMDLGIPFHIYEMSCDFGGTWLKNEYPGCGCDVISHCYSFSWAPNPNWSRKWVGRDEIMRNITYIARDMLGLHEHTSFGTKVVGATFVGDKEWHVETVTWDGDGNEVVMPVRKHTFFVCALGQLNIPTIPQGLSNTMGRFKGKAQFHSAHWDTKVDMTGLRVACIGSGASAIQLGPAIAPLVKELVVFQRTPAWVGFRRDYAYPEWVKMMFRMVPLTRIMYRYFFLAVSDFLFYVLIQGSGPKVPTKRNMAIQNMLLNFLVKNAPKELHDVLTPKEILGCKRILISDEWYPMFNRDNVSLVAEGVMEITGNGVKTVSGKEIPVDVIVYATGFETSSFMKSISMRVQDPVTEVVHVIPNSTFQRAYRGLTYAGVPNFGCCYAANTNVNHSSILAMIEAEVSQLGQLFRAVVGDDTKHKFEVKTEAYEKFNAREQKLLETTAFSAECNSWYKQNDEKVIYNNYHGSTHEFWMDTANVRWGDYVLS